VLNLKACTFTQVNEGEVYVSGSRHEETPYALKLEGARQVGFRCLTIAGTRDPIMIAGIDTILEEVQASGARNLSLNDDSIRMTFHLYGKNGVM
ncbi:3-methylaspartate ammonia-lyase, partial [Streptococcus pseudopneumoniae]|nr:3-methylaspartate ammonia-lyase [Streptococcus pseudopneumoniae]